MAHRPLDNYLRTHRKRSGLSQKDVAFLLGYKNGALVSRYEKRERLPPLKTALACEAIFGVPIAELFAGVQTGIAKNVAKRRVALKEMLVAKTANTDQSRITQHKLRWLGEDKAPSVENHVASTA